MSHGSVNNLYAGTAYRQHELDRVPILCSAGISHLPIWEMLDYLRIMYRYVPVPVCRYPVVVGRSLVGH